MANQLSSTLFSVAALAISSIAHTGPIYEFKSIDWSLETGIDKFFESGVVERDAYTRWSGDYFPAAQLELDVPEFKWINPNDNDRYGSGGRAIGEWHDLTSSGYHGTATTAFTDILYPPLPLDGIYIGQPFAIAEMSLTFKVKGEGAFYRGLARADGGVSSGEDCVHKVVDMTVGAEILDLGGSVCFSPSLIDIDLKDGHVYKVKTRIVHNNGNTDDNEQIGILRSKDGEAAYAVPEPSILMVILLGAIMVFSAPIRLKSLLKR